MYNNKGWFAFLNKELPFWLEA